MHVGRHYYWFQPDDWNLLIGVDGGNLRDLFHELHDHWSTIPIVMDRVLFNLFGLRYEPYLVAVVLLHLTIAVLLPHCHAPCR